MTSKAYDNCIKIYKWLAQNYIDDRGNYLNFPESELENGIGMFIGVDKRTLELYKNWFTRFKFAGKVNGKVYFLIPQNEDKIIDRAQTKIIEIVER